MLGERGTTLSGGQRQRLAIARALLAEPRILILDDATAAVDPETENDIHRAIRLMMHERTIFVIAHRISTIKTANLVVVIENGRAAQIGTHDELLAREGHYRQIVNGQLYGDLRADDAEAPSHMKRMREFFEKKEKAASQPAPNEECASEPAP
jgi:ABC-type multidrug transport system fused ATPase/permease subunit